MTLAESASPSRRASIRRDTVTLPPAAVMRLSHSASSTVIAAAGMAGTPSA